METKIKIQKLLPSGSIPQFNYASSTSFWGLSGDYKGYRLEFSQPRKIGNWVFFDLKNFFGRSNGQNFSSNTIDIYKLFSPDAKKVWDESYDYCRKRGGTELSVEDVFLSLLNSNSVMLMFERMKVNPKEAKKLINNYLKLTPPLCGLSVKKIPFEAFSLAIKLHNHKVGTLMLLGALLKATPHENILQAIFSNIGLTAAKLEVFSVWFLKLNYDFPKDCTSEKILYCLNQAEALEQHFGYFFEFPALERAVLLSRGETLKDLEHKKALQLLVKASLLAKSKNKKIITADYIK